MANIHCGSLEERSARNAKSRNPQIPKAFAGLVLIALTTLTAAAQSPLPAAPPVASKYWLGVEFLPVMPALRAHLNLSDRHGLLVQAVTPGSPAAKVGIIQYDVLLRAGEKSLGAPADLIEALDASKGEKLKIELIRGGKPRTIEVVPASRPAGLSSTAARPAEPEDWDTIQQWMRGVWGSENGQSAAPRRFHIAGPAAIVPSDALISRPLPPNLSVVVSKQGEQPAKITVQRGDKTWDLSEKELDQLPADIRPFVDQMLGRTVFGPFAPSGIAGAVPGLAQWPQSRGPEQPPQVQPFPGIGTGDRRLQDRLDEIDRRLERLFRAVDDLREQRKQPEGK
jgi:serine protease Do